MRDMLVNLLLVLGLVCLAAACFQLAGWVNLGVSPAVQLIVGAVVILLGMLRARRQAGA